MNQCLVGVLQYYWVFISYKVCLNSLQWDEFITLLSFDIMLNSTKLTVFA